MQKITTAQENYIKNIYELSLREEGVRISDIATKFGVTKASASVAVKSLQKKSLVHRGAGRLVYLTDEGRKQALYVSDKFSIICEFLTNILHVDLQTAHAEAGALEHVISAETLCALCRLINRHACYDECAIHQDIVRLK